MPEPLFGSDAFSPAQISEKVEQVGVTKARLPLLQMGMLGVLGGADFSLGLLLVVIAGAELFTGNNLLVMAWAEGRGQPIPG